MIIARHSELKHKPCYVTVTKGSTVPVSTSKYGTVLLLVSTRHRSSCYDIVNLVGICTVSGCTVCYVMFVFVGMTSKQTTTAGGG